MARCLKCTPLERKEEVSTAKVPFYFRQDMKVDIISTLKDIKQDILLGRDVEYKNLYSLFKGLNFEQDTLQSSISFLIETSKFLEKYRCKHTNVISDIFRIIYYATFYTGLQTKEKSIKKISTLEERNCLISVSRTATDDREDYIWYTFKCGSLGLLKLMLKFGMEMLYSDDLGDIWIDLLVIEIKLLRPHYPEGNLSVSEIFDKCSETIDAFREATVNCNMKQKKRVVLALRVLHILAEIMFVPGNSENHIKCYKLLFDSIGDPYISSSEVRALLESYLPPAYKNAIFRVAETFKCVLPGVSDVPQPRTLKHLCRVQIRDSLRQTSNLPYGVSSLKLPNLLKRYILLNDDGDYSALTIESGTYKTRLISSRSTVKLEVPEDPLMEHIKCL